MKPLSAIFATFTLLLLFLSPASAASTNVITIIHGLPDIKVDVYLDKELILDDVTPNTVSDPIEVEDGLHDIEIRDFQSGPSAVPILSALDIDIRDGANLSAIAFLGTNQDFSLSVFENDISNIKEGHARVTVRHAAQAANADVLADGNVLFSELNNRTEGKSEVPVGTYDITIAPTGTTDTVFGPMELELREGNHIIIFAVGSLDNDTFSIVWQAVTGLTDSPDAINSGNSGLVSDNNWLQPFFSGFLAMAIVLVVRRRYEMT